MDLQSGYPFWLIRDGLPFSYPKLEEDTATDVLILGGGISGALLAYYFAEAGINAVLADSRTIGLGSTCASTALLQYEIDVPLTELTGMKGEKDAVRAYKLCSAAIDKLETIAAQLSFLFERKSSLYYAAYKKDTGWLYREYQARHAHGFKVQYLGEKQIRDLFGFGAPAAIWSEQAAQVDAYGLAHALLQHAIGKGLRVFDRTDAASISHEKRGVTVKTAAGFTIKAKKLVYATGYESVRYIDKKFVDLNSTYATISEQHNEGAVFWKDETLIWNTASPYLYMRITDDRRILVGGRDEMFYNPTRRDRLIRHKARQLAGDFCKLFPGIEFKSEFNWTGTFGATKDGLPYIGPYKPLPNAYFALGLGGNGITFSVVAAEIITDLILGKHNEDAHLFGFERI